METLGLDKFMDDFADIGITMNGAGTADLPHRLWRC